VLETSADSAGLISPTRSVPSAVAFAHDKQHTLKICLIINSQGIISSSVDQLVSISFLLAAGTIKNSCQDGSSWTPSPPPAAPAPSLTKLTPFDRHTHPSSALIRHHVFSIDHHGVNKLNRCIFAWDRCQRA
jgi:hypothetical protein